MRVATAFAIFGVAYSGNGNTALTLVSHSTYVSSPVADFGPYRKSASQMTGSDARSMSRMRIIAGVHSDSIFRLSAWNAGSDASDMIRGPGSAGSIPGDDGISALTS